MVFLSQNSMFDILKMFGILNDQIINYLLSENMVNKFIFFANSCVNVGVSKILKEVELHITRQYLSLKEYISKLCHLRPPSFTFCRHYSQAEN